MQKQLILDDLSSIPWSILKRFEFIEFRLYWEERINRSDLVDTFKISIPQASSDLSKYQKLAPGNIGYDPKNKYYFPSSSFEPKFTKPSTDQYLLRYIALDLGIYQHKNSFLGFVPEIGTVPRPWRRVELKVLKTILKAIREKLAIEIEYQSMSRDKKLTRWISPHALGFDGFRWHCRSFCHVDNKFKDFNLGRIFNIHNIKPDEIDSMNDNDWNNMVTVKIAPNPKLNKAKKKIIEYEYGMENGVTSIDVKRAMLFYLLRSLGLDINQKDENPVSQHIVLLNKEEICKFKN